MMDDFMSPNFRPTIYLMPYRSIFPFRLTVIDLHGVAWLSPLTGCLPRRWRVRYLVMIPQWSLFGAIQPDPHFSTFGCCHAYYFGRHFIDVWVWLDYRDCAFDDGWFHVTQFLTYHTSDAIRGHISFLGEVYRSSWSCMIFPTHEMRTKAMTCSLFLQGFLIGASWEPSS